MSKFIITQFTRFSWMGFLSNLNPSLFLQILYSNWDRLIIINSREKMYIIKIYNTSLNWPLKLLVCWTSCTFPQQGLTLSFIVCACSTHECMHACSHVWWVLMCVYMCGFQKVISHVIFYQSPPYLLNQELSLDYRGHWFGQSYVLAPGTLALLPDLWGYW